MMKKMLALLAVATLPATLSGCASCCPSLSLCPCCPCNWFNRPAAACPPAPVCCPPAPMYAAPLAATACPPPCAPACPPVASQMMPQYVMPTSSAFGAAPCSSCQPMAAPQQMFAQPAYYSEPGCAFEPGCGAPFNVSYGPAMPCECGGCDSCSGCDSGCCGEGGAALSAPAPEAYVQPAPVND